MKHIYSKKIKFCKTFTYKLEKLTKRFNDADGARKKGKLISLQMNDINNSLNKNK